MSKRKVGPVKEMIRLYESGLSAVQIAEHYGADSSGIYSQFRKAKYEVRPRTVAVRLGQLRSPRTLDLVGQHFGKLVVLERLTSRRNHLVEWLCQCKCGNQHVTTTAMLRGGQKSCGCVQPGLKHGHASGGRRTPEYQSWASMLSRCLSPTHEAYNRYGGRGITICDRWRSFDNFYSDMGPRPSPKHSLDRYPDNNGNYEPGNVRWATSTEQNRNRRFNHMLTIAGITCCIAQWVEATGVPYATMWYRWKAGCQDMELIHGRSRQ